MPTCVGVMLGVTLGPRVFGCDARCFGLGRAAKIKVQLGVKQTRCPEFRCYGPPAQILKGVSTSQSAECMNAAALPCRKAGLMAFLFFKAEGIESRRLKIIEILTQCKTVTPPKLHEKIQTEAKKMPVDSNARPARTIPHHLPSLVTLST